jgi:Piwi domain
MILQGVARQILQKSGARLWWVDIPKSLPLPTVFVGIDVFHAPVVYDPKSKSKGRKASVAAIIIEVIRKHSSPPTRLEMYSKTFRRQGGVEYNLGNELKETLQEAFRELNVVPASVIVWRDGLPEMAYNHAKEEMQGICNGLSRDVVGVKSAPSPIVPMAYIVCQKRIATKFLTPDGKFGSPSGTLVTSLQGPEHSIFYINGRAPPYSTPKPVRFICMRRDDGLKAVPLAQLTWGQCHAYPNWTGPIKVPSVTQKAHKLAELAGAFIDGGDTINCKALKNKDHFL